MLTCYRADKRTFSIGDKVESAGQYYEKFTAVGKAVEDALESNRPASKVVRTSCLFVFSNEVHARNHWSWMTNGKLYVVECDEKLVLHRGDIAIMDAMKAKLELREEVDDLAQSYWRGDMTANPVIEILLPFATVAGVISCSESERQDYLLQRYKL